MPIKRKSSGRSWVTAVEIMEGENDTMATFVRACEEGDLGEVEDLLKIVSLPSFPRENLEALYRPPIYWACKNGHLEVLKLLIKKYPGCNPHLVTDKGHNLFHVACARGHIKTACYLHKNYNISATEPNSHGISPIFTATNSGHFGMVKFLIDDLKCSPRTLNDNGDGLLHHACYKNHLDIARYLVEEHRLNPEMVNKSSKTPLHSACSGGSLPIVKYLVENMKCKIEVFDNLGSSPLHSACRNGFSDIVKYLIERKCNLILYDSSGCTPFHVACQFGRKEVVRVLLRSKKIDPNGVTLRGLSPSDLTKDPGTIRELIRGGLNTCGLIEVFEEYRQDYPLSSTLHVFMVGHSSSGKSTLVAALQKQKKKFPVFPPAPVPPNTAGVVSVDHNSPEFGKVLFYDFAGHDEYHPSHAALLEHSQFASPPLFLLLINLVDTYQELKRKINYWIQFIENHCLPRGDSPSVMVIGSHPDMLPKSNLANVQQIQEYIKYRVASSILCFKGFYSSDCRYPSTNFRSSLRDCCSELRKNLPVEPPSHVLYAVLQQHFSKSFACNINDIIKKAEEYDYPLPLQHVVICKHAECVSARTKLIFLKNNLDLENSWIVMDIDSLLQKIHGKIFAPKGLPEHVFRPTDAGILPWSEITHQFPDLNPSLVIAFLHRLEFCHIISDSEVLKLIEGKRHDDEKDGPNKHSSTEKSIPYSRSQSDGHKHVFLHHPIDSTRCHSCGLLPQHFGDIIPGRSMDDQYLFFPSLISPEQPSGDMWLNENIYEHYFGWCIQCTNDHDFFVLRFIQTLLLRLSFNFAVTKSSSGKCNQLECTLWKNGLRWLSLNGIETIVEFIEDRKALVLLIRITQQSLMSGLHLRSAVVRKILDTKNEYCSQVDTEEYLIHPDDLKARHGYPVINKPVVKLRRYDVGLVARAFCDHSSYVYDMEKRVHARIEDILGFDPYMKLGEALLRIIYTNGRLDYDILYQISECYPDKHSYFEHILNVPRVINHPPSQESRNPCFDVLDRFWESRCSWNIIDLRRKLDVYSIFQGRNILSL